MQLSHLMKLQLPFQLINKNIQFHKTQPSQYLLLVTFNILLFILPLIFLSLVFLPLVFLSFQNLFKYQKSLFEFEPRNMSNKATDSLYSYDQHALKVKIINHIL